MFSSIISMEELVYIVFRQQKGTRQGRREEIIRRKRIKILLPCLYHDITFHGLNRLPCNILDIDRHTKKRDGKCIRGMLREGVRMITKRIIFAGCISQVENVKGETGVKGSGVNS